MDTLFSMKVFCQVVQSGSFTRAADLLDISIPMTSKHVVHLEKHVGAQLLYRNNRSLKLTEQGESYYQDCLTALDVLEQAAAQATQGTKTPQGTLRISAPVWFACDRFAQLIAKYCEQYPKVEPVLTLSNRHVDLNSDGEDIALRLSHSLAENIIARPLGVIPFYLVATQQYLAKHGHPKTAEDFAQHNAILPSYTDMSQQKVKLGGEQITLQLHGKIQSNHTQMVASMIYAHAGIGYMPAWLADEDLSTGKLVNLLPEPITNPPLYAVYAKRQFMKATVRSFIDFLAKELQPEK
ncbi:LysR family transcriptional regulator [Kingella negevensis]|uniref:LysR family transcriptional regulator n=1 Tax=Kingella negevensis TaxID=1522312 RepID=UPI00254D52B8|nr:LysR family transcriptional regulator [Kingella negevensis]MDK4679747.1 LysR family transcriptional regulator [Kingella negevensis]MDK4682535.1 LysR family transcriptional regulator [Kingella negevensis]MDK4690731.1 LysR family transcriptional regulator [Kingella negevensis]MDK4694121.1 LysR family transcriptional regulator [Kingella negevensis]MDK4699850.1 LysR family transcriptional regulator [Kingella negevensis]